MKDFENIAEMLLNGNWSDAIAEFQAINPTPREYQNWLESRPDKDELKDLALLGFYAREYKPDDRKY